MLRRRVCDYRCPGVRDESGASRRPKRTSSISLDKMDHTLGSLRPCTVEPFHDLADRPEFTFIVKVGKFHYSCGSPRISSRDFRMVSQPCAGHRAAFGFAIGQREATGPDFLTVGGLGSPETAPARVPAAFYLRRRNCRTLDKDVLISIVAVRHPPAFIEPYTYRPTAIQSAMGQIASRHGTRRTRPRKSQELRARTLVPTNGP